MQELYEIDGNGQRANVTGIIGGMLGQIIICFQGLIKKYGSEIPALSDPKTVQWFLYQFIDQRLKSEKLPLVVGKCIEEFLNSLDKPLQLNEMRIMKEANYVRFRELLNDHTQFGDPILRYFHPASQHKYDARVDPSVFSLVFNSFWDLYCKKPVNP